MALAATLSGCATAVPVVDYYDADSSTLRRFQSIDVLSDEAAEGKNLKNLGEIQGIYCKKTHEQVPVHDEGARTLAIDQVKLKAAEKSADYISTPKCVISGSSDFTNNCYSTLMCTSSAFKTDD